MEFAAASSLAFMFSYWSGVGHSNDRSSFLVLFCFSFLEWELHEYAVVIRAIGSICSEHGR